MNIEPGARQQAFLVDGFKKLRGRSVIENVGRHGFFQFNIDGDGMTLPGTNHSPIRAVFIALLVVGTNKRVESKANNKVFAFFPEREYLRLKVKGTTSFSHSSFYPISYFCKIVK